MEPTDITVPISENHQIVENCGAPAPAVVNGGLYLGCALPKNHEENEHRTMVIWPRL
jgi:hypothetical protein